MITCARWVCLDCIADHLVLLGHMTLHHLHTVMLDMSARLAWRDKLHCKNANCCKTAIQLQIVLGALLISSAVGRQQAHKAAVESAKLVLLLLLLHYCFVFHSPTCLAALSISALHFFVFLWQHCVTPVERLTSRCCEHLAFL